MRMREINRPLNWRPRPYQTGMCGIFACLYHSDGRNKQHNNIKESVIGVLQRRGPDCLHEVCLQLRGGGGRRGGRLQLELLGTLLCMRGKPTPLPLGNEAGNWLLWNGNVFGGSIKVGSGENDTVKVLKELSAAKTHSALLEVLSAIHGPWSFVFWQASTQSLWFGRDVFGRRSLLWHLPRGVDDCFALSSVAHGHTPLDYWLEVPAVGIFRLSCSEFSELESTNVLECYLWMQEASTFQSEEVIADELDSLNTTLKIAPIKGENPVVFFPSMNKSGLLAPSDSERVDLTSPPAQTVSPSRKGVCDASSSHVSKFMEVLLGSVERRVSRAPPVLRRECIKIDGVAEVKDVEEEAQPVDVKDPETATAGGGDGDVIKGGACVAVLFSGGVDSAVLAALVDKCLDPEEDIDLINVAFEQRHLPDSDPTRFDVPDRLSGLACLQELNQKRKWNFIKVNVTLQEVNKMREDVISNLVHPLNTVLDDSIGCALWFSARGRGLLHSPEPGNRMEYQSSARTLLVGIGADEQMAGYARHRTKFKTGGMVSVIAEVEMDIKRLAKRNFGRDDRCVADHQRDAQYPFLDEEVVAYLQQLPMALKADLSLPRGVGEKKLLREVAALLRCHTAATQPKRAIQFGSRMAKLAGSSNNRERGADQCKRLFSN